MNTLRFIFISFVFLAFGTSKAQDVMHLDFGEVLPGSETTRRLEFRNDGTNELFLARIMCGDGVTASSSRDWMPPSCRVSLSVTFKAGETGGTVESAVKLYLAGKPAPWKTIAVTAKVSGNQAPDTMVMTQCTNEVWRSSDEIILIGDGKYEGDWRPILARERETLESRASRPREKAIAKRVITIVVKSAYDAAGDLGDVDLPDNQSYSFYAYPEAAEAERAYRRRVADRIDAENAKRMAEKRAKFQAEWEAKQERERIRREETKARIAREQEEREHEEARKRQERENAEIEYLDYVTWKPPEYFTQEFFENTFLAFLAKELQIPAGDKGAEYRSMLAEGFSAYLKPCRTPFADACNAMKKMGARKIDRKRRGGKRLQTCFSWLFGGGSSIAVYIQDKGEKERIVQGNIGAAKCAWDGRRGMAFRFLGTAYSLLYMGGSLNYGQKVSEQLVDKYGKEGLAYAIEWCKALEIENPGDDTWKKCVHPFLREAFLHCPKLKEELAKAIGEIQ